MAVKAKKLHLTSYQLEVVTTPWRDGRGALKQTLEKARRIGGSTSAALLSALWCLGRELRSDGTFTQRPPMNVYVVSKDFQSSKDLLRETSEICAGLEDDDPDFDIDPQATVLKFRTGCTVHALACSPAACRGKTGAVIGDEIAFWRRQEDMWGAVKSIMDPNLGDGDGYPGLLLTTPWDSGSLAHRLLTDGGLSFADFKAGKTFPSSGYPFIRHRVDIYDAVKAGFPINIEKAFAELGIPELIDTEYKCVWRGGSSTFFPLDKMRETQVDVLPDGWQDMPVYFGVDCGGARGRDNTAIVQWRVDDFELLFAGLKAWNRTPEDLGEDRTKLEWQADQIVEWILACTSLFTPIVIAVDRGIMGADIIDLVRRKLKGKRHNVEIVGVGMSHTDQAVYAKAARKALEKKRWRIYTGTEAGGDENGARALLLELNSLKTTPGENGVLHFITPRDASQRHRDRAWAALIGIAKAAKCRTNNEDDSTSDSAEQEPPAVRRYFSALGGI